MDAEVQTVEIVVVGAGIAGLIAATKAAMEGRAVAVLERRPEDKYLCNSRLTGGVFHCCRMDIRTDPVELEAALMEAGGEDADPNIANAIANDSLRVVRWMQEIGVRFVRGHGAFSYHTFVLAPPNLARLGLDWEGRGGDVLLRLLEKRISDRGGRLLRGYEVRDLVMKQGRCVGVTGQRTDGTKFSFNADAVVLADGGFQANPELLKEVTSKPEALVQRNAGGGVGSVLEMSRRVGAKISDLKSFYGHLVSRDALTNPLLWPYPWLDDIVKQSMIVDATGRRFVDEGRGGIAVANSVARLRDPGAAWVICDLRGWEGPAQGAFLPPNPNLEKAGGTVIRASTLGELATRAGIDGQTLIATVETFNQAVAGGTIDPPRSGNGSVTPPLPIALPPFFALPTAAGITYTMGGPVIDEHCRMLAKAGGTIHGVYCVGSSAGGIEGGEHAGYCGGLIKAAVTGLRSAEHICSASRAERDAARSARA